MLHPSYQILAQPIIDELIGEFRQANIPLDDSAAALLQAAVRLLNCRYPAGFTAEILRDLADQVERNLQPSLGDPP